MVGIWRYVERGTNQLGQDTPTPSSLKWPITWFSRYTIKRPISLSLKNRRLIMKQRRPFLPVRGWIGCISRTPPYYTFHLIIRPINVNAEGRVNITDYSFINMNAAGVFQICADGSIQITKSESSEVLFDSLLDSAAIAELHKAASVSFGGRKHRLCVNCHKTIVKYIAHENALHYAQNKEKYNPSCSFAKVYLSDIYPTALDTHQCK